MSDTARHPRILVVDDEPEIREFTTEILRSHGLEVVAVADGSSALVEAVRQRFDLCVLDVNMPGMDGLEVCRHLRAVPFTRTLPVLFLTGIPDTTTIDNAFAAGATDYLVKPVNTTVLWARVSNLLKINELTRKAENTREAIELLSMALRLPSGKGSVRLGC